MQTEAMSGLAEVPIHPLTLPPTPTVCMTSGASIAGHAECIAHLSSENWRIPHRVSLLSSAGRSPKLYDDPECFRPERWLKPRKAGGQADQTGLKQAKPIHATHEYD